MTAATTEGVKVTVETEYMPEYSSPAQNHYVFTYQVTIHNLSNHTIKLLTRHWKIEDAAQKTREINGDGVVGKQPVIEPGEIHRYVSGCNLKSGLGKMSGFYSVERLVDGKPFNVTIPAFSLIVPFRLN